MALRGVTGLLIGEHHFLLQPIAYGTAVNRSKHFSSLLPWLFDPQVPVPRFEAMNVALAIRATGASRCPPDRVIILSSFDPFRRLERAPFSCLSGLRLL